MIEYKHDSILWEIWYYCNRLLICYDDYDNYDNDYNEYDDDRNTDYNDENSDVKCYT
jgi:hypothetical protein